MLTFPAYILAGGRSRRFGSDKARAQVNGAPTIVRLAASLRSIASSITVVADRAQKYHDLGLHTIVDEHPGAGPLAGLEAAALDCSNRNIPGEFETSWFILIACDFLMVEPSWFVSLYENRDRDSLASLFRDSVAVQSLCGLYHVDVLSHVRALLARREHRMQELLNHIRTTLVPAPFDLSESIHFNTRMEFARAVGSGSSAGG